MRRGNFQFIGYIILNGLHSTALFAARPFLSLIAIENGASVLSVGIITSLYSISQVLWAIPLGFLLDRYGSKIAARCGAALFLIAALGLSFSNNLITVALCSVGIGLSHVTVLLSVQHLLTGVAEDGKREQFIGMIAFTASAGAFLGPLIGGFMREQFGPGRGFLGAAAMGMLCLILALITPTERFYARSDKRIPLTGLLRDNNIMRSVMVSGTVLFSTEVTMSYLPLYCAEIGISAMTIGTIMSVKGVTQMIIRPFLKQMVQFFRRDRLLILCLLLGGSCIAAYGLVRSSWLFFMVAGLAGLSIGLAMPLTLLSVSIAAPPDQRSQVLALRVMGNYLGQSISPLLFGLIGQMVGLAPVFWISGLAMAFSSRIIHYKGKASRKSARRLI
ncbi:MAG: MFS transporter [Bacillota bacterium]|nr:MFS transporter [Bacillota bacterium]